MLGFDKLAGVGCRRCVEPLHLGIDAGGTRTRAVLVAADGSVAGVGAGPAANPNNLGMERAVAALAEAAAAAWVAAGRAGGAAAACFIGSAGVKAAADTAELAVRAAAAGLGPAGRCVVANDTEAALAGGLPGRPGVALVAGTGSFCLGRDASARVARCGGWGWVMDDIGSGFWLGREALRAAVMAADGRGAPTVLLERVLEAHGTADPDDLLARVYAGGADPVRIAALAPLVAGAAVEGDAVAWALVRAGAEGLARLVQVVAARLSWPGGAPEVVLVGGVARSGPPVTPAIEAAVRSRVPGVVLREPELPPAAGAALRALEAGGVAVSPAVVARLAAAVREEALC